MGCAEYRGLRVAVRDTKGGTFTPGISTERDGLVESTISRGDQESKVLDRKNSRHPKKVKGDGKQKGRNVSSLNRESFPTLP